MPAALVVGADADADADADAGLLGVDIPLKKEKY